MRQLLLLLFALLLSGAIRTETLKVFAAASLKESFETAAAQYEQENPGDKVELNFAGSQVLKQQILQGAPADVFASADQAHMDDLKKQGLMKGDRVFARNRLVLAVPKVGKVASLADAGLPGLKVVMADGSVPAGRYTSQVLEKMGKDSRYGADFPERIHANIVSQETNVRAVLMKVSLGEADAGFVYATDAATLLDKVRTIDIPDQVNMIAVYPIAVAVKSAAPAKAQKFVDLVLGERGQSFLRKNGFLPPQ